MSDPYYSGYSTLSFSITANTYKLKYSNYPDAGCTGTETVIIDMEASVSVGATSTITGWTSGAPAGLPLNAKFTPIKLTLTSISGTDVQGISAGAINNIGFVIDNRSSSSVTIYNVDTSTNEANTSGATQSK